MLVQFDRLYIIHYTLFKSQDEREISQQEERIFQGKKS